MNSTEIAKLAGVSRSTVSRVINNYSNVPEETKEKVLEVINKYNYVPHASARMLAGKKNKTLGLFLIDQKPETKSSKVFVSDYFSKITSAVVDLANKYSYNVLVAIVGKNKDFKNVRELFYNRTISAGIFVGAKNDHPEIIDLINQGFKIAIMDQDVKDSKDPFNKCIVVNADSYSGAYDSTVYLIKLGHKKIAHITGDFTSNSSIKRLEGYKNALIDNNINVKNSYIIKGLFTEESGYSCTKKIFLKENPTAIIVDNDTMCLGVMRALGELNLKIPEDVSIIGFDDIEISKYITPPLTTNRLNLFEMSEVLTSNIIKVVEEDSDYSAQYLIPVKLIERKSCKSI